MESLKDTIWIEKYRPSNFEDLILDSFEKNKIFGLLEKPSQIPSLIFYSSSPGTGKTTCAKIIAKKLECDLLKINSSDERGIDTIREKIKLFSRSLSSNPSVKRCIFLDEADGLTKQAQDSLRNLMEEYNDNCFFIFTANDYNKIIDPIKSRCVSIFFERPDKTSISARLQDIIQKENLFIEDNIIEDLIDHLYPDIRSMIQSLQLSDNKGFIDFKKDIESFILMIKNKDIKGIYDSIYSGSMVPSKINKSLFKWIFEEHNNNRISFFQCKDICNYLADSEKYFYIGVNNEIVFLTNILNIMSILK